MPFRSCTSCILLCLQIYEGLRMAAFPSNWSLFSSSDSFDGHYKYGSWLHESKHRMPTVRMLRFIEVHVITCHRGVLYLHTKSRFFRHITKGFIWQGGSNHLKTREEWPKLPRYIGLFFGVLCVPLTSGCHFHAVCALGSLFPVSRGLASQKERTRILVRKPRPQNKGFVQWSSQKRLDSGFL